MSWVDLPALRSPGETVEIDGREYALVIEGFLQGGELVTQFVPPRTAPTAPISSPSSLLVVEAGSERTCSRSSTRTAPGTRQGCFTSRRARSSPSNIRLVIGGLGRGSKLTGFLVSRPDGRLAQAQPRLLSLAASERGADGEPLAIDAFADPRRRERASPRASPRSPARGQVTDAPLRGPGARQRGAHAGRSWLCRPGVQEEQAEPEVCFVDLVVVIDSERVDAAATPRRPQRTP